MIACPHLDGEKVRVTRFTDADLTGEYLGWLNDPEVVRFSNQRFVEHTLENCRAYLGSFIGSPNLFLSIKRREDGEAIGTMTVYCKPQHGTADVGIMIGARQYWSGGYGQEAWSLVLDWLLGDAGLRKVTAGTLACNIGMIKLIERSRMVHEGTRKAQELVDNEPQDLMLYGRFR